MAALGFSYQKRMYEKSADISVASLSPYILTLDKAQAHGFGAVDGILAELGDQGNDDFQGSSSDTSSDSTAYSTALFGDGSPGSGCRAQAQAEADQEVSPSDYPAIRDRITIWSKVQADPRYLAFWASWSKCMAVQGITASDQYALIADFGDRAAKLITFRDPVFDKDTGEMISQPTRDINIAAADILRQQEVAAAVADVQCLETLRGQWDLIVSDAGKG